MNQAFKLMGELFATFDKRMKEKSRGTGYFI
jgi:hypothetical protein